MNFIDCMVQISGTTAAAETKGIQTYEDGTKTGVGVTLKHFAFNNQESERFNNNSVMSERAAREGRNPQSGEPMTIAASKAPKFKAGKALKDMINEK